MRAEDLRIGDLLRVNRDGLCIKKDTIVQVRGIDGEDKLEEMRLVGAAHCHPLDKYQFDGGIWVDYLDPIPLSPEILEKNGFEKLDFSHFQIGDRRLVLDADGRWDGPLSWHWVVTEMSTNAKGQPVVLDYYVATINYVHELQHALRLCGITKEIQI